MSAKPKVLTVKAIKLGYYNHRRQKPGVVFLMREDDYQPKKSDGTPILGKDGKPVTCSWAKPVEELAALEVEKELDPIEEAPVASGLVPLEPIEGEASAPSAPKKKKGFLSKGSKADDGSVI